MTTSASFKVLSWNVQYMAGKDYVFYYDVLDFNGPDERPSSDSIARTLKEVARVIMAESADFVLLQEVDDGASRTDKQDQAALLLKHLEGQYPCHASAFYWKAGFVPHPRIMGSAGMKLTTLSKYKIVEAKRHQLPQMPDDIISRQFNLKRAILETRIQVEQNKSFALFNTHFDAFAQGTNTLQRQVAVTHRLFAETEKKGIPWVAGGDLNILPPGRHQLDSMPESYRGHYNDTSELEPIYRDFQVIQGIDESKNSEWFTHFSNDPLFKGPDRTIDYLVFSHKLKAAEHRVRRNDTLKISDHLPVISRFYYRR